MPFRLGAGEGYNLLSRGIVTVSDEDPNYLRANLWDGYADLPYQALTNGADRLITVDLNLVVALVGGVITNVGGFEVAGLVGWTEASTGTGTTADETTVINSGARALKCTGAGASNVGQRYIDIVVRSGERMGGITFALRGDGTAFARIRLQNRATGKYLKSDLTWAAGVQDLGARDTASYATTTLGAFTIEDSFDRIPGGSLVTLRLTCLCNDTGSAYFDDIYFNPKWNAVSVHGHNLDQVSPEVRSSTDGFSGSDTLEATLAIKQPSFYGILGADNSRRYARLKLAGTNSSTPYLSELAIFYAEELAKGHEHGWSIAYLPYNVSQTGPGGKRFVTRRSLQDRRVLSLPFKQQISADFIQFRNELYRRCGGDALPLVAMPLYGLGAAEDPAILGRLIGPMRVDRRFLATFESVMELEESPFLTATP